MIVNEKNGQEMESRFYSFSSVPPGKMGFLLTACYLRQAQDL